MYSDTVKDIFSSGKSLKCRTKAKVPCYELRQESTCLSMKTGKKSHLGQTESSIIAFSERRVHCQIQKTLTKLDEGCDRNRNSAFRRIPVKRVSGFLAKSKLARLLALTTASR